MDSTILSEVELIREAFHYKSRFEGSTLVFKIDFPVIESSGFPYLMKDMALLAQTGFKVVIVPGAKEYIDLFLEKRGIGTSWATTDNLSAPSRITGELAMPYVEMAAFHAATRFMTHLSGSRVEALVGNFVRARGLGVVNGVDMGHTGTVDKIYVDSIQRVLNLGMVAILPCIGWSPAGKPYNVSGDEIALAVAKALDASKFFIVSNFGEKSYSAVTIPAEFKTRPDGRPERLTPQELETVITVNESAGVSNNAAKQVLRDLKLALRACRAGAQRVHIIDSGDDGALLKELFTNLGAGTMIYADEYDSIRNLRSRDVPDILRLMEPLMQIGVLIRRNVEQIQEKKDDYIVCEIDGSIHACGALHDWGESQGEIAAIATDPIYTDLGAGRKVVSYLIDRARKKNMRRVFVLTTQTQDWFENLGFSEVALETLPEKKRKVYDQQRKSKIFALDLTKNNGKR